MPAEVGLVLDSLESICRASSSRPCSTKTVTWEGTQEHKHSRRLGSHSAHTGFLALEKRDGSLPPEVIQFVQSPSFNLYHAFQTAHCNPLQVMTNF